MKVRGLVLAVALHAAAWAQTPSLSQLPRTPAGHPDFGGTWSSRFQTPIERLEGAASLVVSDANARAMGEGLFQKLTTRGAADDPDVEAAGVRNLLQVNGEWRTSQITSPTDGKLPLTERGQRIVAEWRAGVAARPDGPEARMETERCVAGTGRAPFVNFPEENIRQIVQTADYLAIYTEFGPDLRIIDFGPQYHPAPSPSWSGNQTASWERDELVITTTNQRGLVLGTILGALVMRPEARVIERLRMLSRDQILYRYTIEDSAIYSAPWSAEFVLNRSPLPALEYGCHEGNYALVNMLSSARASERTAAAAKAKPPGTGKGRP